MVAENPTKKRDTKRGPGGKFLPGTRGGPGNPYAKRVHRLRSLIHDAVTDKDLEDIIHVLVNRSKKGDIPAVQLLLAYLIGKPDGHNLTVDDPEKSATVLIRFEDATTV